MIEVGSRKYEFVEGWGALPNGWDWGQAAAVGVDSQDRVHVLARTEHPYTVFDRSGELLSAWGYGLLEDPHGIYIDSEDNVFVVDREPGIVYKFTNDGKHLLTLGHKGQESDTGYDAEARSVAHAGPPFNWPTDVCLSPGGEIYVSDGYRNCRVHKYAADGTLLFSWGEPGEGDGQFRLVHSVWEHNGRTYVADRANNRIQVFTPDGEYLDTWPGFLLPCKIFVDQDDIMYVAELGGRVSILNLEGEVIGRMGGGNRAGDPGDLVAPHGIWTDSQGDMYVSEVLKSAKLQKFARVR